MEQVDTGATISICGMSEPFSNQKCADMILYAYEKGYSICLNTTLMGATIEDLKKIKDVRFENFILHIPDSEKHSKFIVDNSYLELLDFVHKTQQIDYYSCHGSVDNEVRKHIDLNKYSGIALADRAGNLDLAGIAHCHNEGHLICMPGSEKSVGIWAPVMLPDGTLILCCNDYGMKHILGNILEQNWTEIISGDAYRMYEKGLSDEHSDILCRYCCSARNVSKLPAIKLAQILSDDSSHESEIRDKFEKADAICVYGLGKYFKDHFFREFWHETIKADYFCDGDSQLWGMNINGTRCCTPQELSKMNNVLVVVFALKSDSIIKSLSEMGITNIITINDLLKI